jgi:hypothetical protein
MAIEKSDAQVESLSVEADGSVSAKVNYLLADGSTVITRAVVDLVISNSTAGERTAAASLVSKAAALAVA